MSDKVYKDAIQHKYELFTSDELMELNSIKGIDSDARGKLIFSCLPLAYSIATRFYSNNKYIEVDDFVQQANLALLRAVDKWEPSKGGTLNTLATYVITNELINMLGRNSYQVNLKLNISQAAMRDLRAIKKIDSTDVETICSKTGLKERRVKLLLPIAHGTRINYSIMDYRLHKSEHHEVVEEANVNGCLADILSMIDDIVEDETEKDIFLTWLTYLKKNGRAQLTAEHTGHTNEVVICTVRDIKKRMQECQSIT